MVALLRGLAAIWVGWSAWWHVHPVVLAGLVWCAWWLSWQAFRLVGRAALRVTRLGDDLGAGGFGLVSATSSRRAAGLLFTVGRWLVVAPWLVLAAGLVVWRFGGWPVVSVAVGGGWASRRWGRI